MSRVFVYEIPRTMDMKTAEGFGAVTPIVTRDRRRPSVFNPNDFSDFVVDELSVAKFDPATDFICVAGQLIGNVLLVAAAVSAYSNVKLLIWDASSEEYKSRELTASASAAG